MDEREGREEVRSLGLKPNLYQKGLVKNGLKEKEDDLLIKDPGY